MNIILNESQYNRLIEQENSLAPKSTVPKTGTKPTTVSQKVSNACSAKWDPTLVKAKSYWVKWLSNPITKDKYKKNWQIDTSDPSANKRVDDIFVRYIKSLDSLKLSYYDNTTTTTNPNAKRSFAFVNGRTPELIYINCSLNDKDPLGTLIHEIQHIIFRIRPLNPSGKIGDVFVGPTTIKSVWNDFLDYFELNTTNPANNIDFNQIAIEIGVKPNSLKKYYEDSVAYDKKNPGYSCSQNEKMSNIMSIRRLFKLNPGQNITYEMIKPYIGGQLRHTDVSWVLRCWALSGFPDINNLLNKINQLAYQQTGNNTNFA